MCIWNQLIYLKQPNIHMNFLSIYSLNTKKNACTVHKQIYKQCFRQMVITTKLVKVALLLWYKNLIMLILVINLNDQCLEEYNSIHVVRERRRKSTTVEAPGVSPHLIFKTTQNRQIILQNQHG